MSNKEGSEKYYDQNWEATKTRYGEHLVHRKCGESDNFSVTNNVSNSRHSLNKKSLKLVKLNKRLWKPTCS